MLCAASPVQTLDDEAGRGRDCRRNLVSNTVMARRALTNYCRSSTVTANFSHYGSLIQLQTPGGHCVLRALHHRTQTRCITVLNGYSISIGCSTLPMPTGSRHLNNHQRVLDFNATSAFNYPHLPYQHGHGTVNSAATSAPTANSPASYCCTDANGYSISTHS